MISGRKDQLFWRPKSANANDERITQIDRRSGDLPIKLSCDQSALARDLYQV
jgi:hypothetical protein